MADKCFHPLRHLPRPSLKPCLKSFTEPGSGDAHTFDPSYQEAEATSEFEASLVYRVSSRMGSKSYTEKPCLENSKTKKERRGWGKEKRETGRRKKNQIPNFFGFVFGFLVFFKIFIYLFCI